MKTKFTTFLCLLFGWLLFAQTTLVNYPFTNVPAGNGLNYDVLDPSYDGITIPFPTLIYGPSPVRYFNNNMLEFVNITDYLTLSINTVGKSGLVVSFEGVADLRGFSLWAEVFVEANTGPGSTFQQIGAVKYLTETKNTYSVILPASAVKSNLQVRLRYSQGVWGNDIVRIDNLKIYTGSPKISIFSDANVEIPDNADAAVSYNTVFGELQTLLEPGESKTYRVRNWYGETGSSLTVNNIEIIPSSGTTANDFMISSSSSTTSLPAVTSFTRCTLYIFTCLQYENTEFGEITIKFVPQGEGVRKADIKVYSNGTPSPYSFTVIGGGKSCDVSNTAYVINTADNGDQTLPSDLGPADYVGGNTNTFVSNGSLTSFFPDPGLGSYNLFTSASTSWYTKDTQKVKTFGGDDGIDVSNLKNVSVEFNVAAFADGNAITKGVTNTDYIILSVTDKNGNFYDVMRLNGSNKIDGNEKRKYQFNTSGKIYVKEFDLPLNVGTSVSNSNNNTGNNGINGGAYARFKFNIPLQYSKDLTNFKFKIRAKANANAVWLIDDISIKSNNAKFKTWDGSKWVPNPADQRPGTKEKAVFDGDYDFTKTGETGDLTVCECEVNAGKVLTIPSNKTLTVQGNVINNGTANNFIVSSDANLIQKEPGAQNVGNITVNRYVSNMRNNPGPDPLVNAVDYVYWSSPVAGQNLQAFSPGTPAANIMQYKEATDYFVTSYDGVFKPAKGYAIRAEGGPSPIPYNKTYQFVGPPNNGDFKIAITRSPNSNGNVHGYNLIGNPYPSNINFDKLYTNNPSLIRYTAWFWKNNTYTPNQQGQGYTGNNYMVYNGVGGNEPGVTGIVKVGQGFLIQKTNLSSDSLNFKNQYNKTNVLRVSTAGTFYQRNDQTKNRFWLKLISPDDMVNTQLIGYIDGATDGFEQDYDAEIMGLSSDIFYSKLEEKRLLIQGKGAFQTTDKVDLGANFFKAGTYTVALDTAEGIFNGSQKIYLRDKETGTLTDLSANPYLFEAAKGISEGRFEVIYEPQQVVLGAEEILGETLIVYRDGGDFIVRAQSKNITDLEVYDGSGRLIYKTQPRHTEVRIPGDKLMRGVHILKIDQNGQLTKKKILK